MVEKEMMMKRAFLGFLLAMLVVLPGFADAKGSAKVFKFAAPWGEVRVVVDAKVIKTLQVKDIEINYTPPTSTYRYVPQREGGIVHQSGFFGWQRTGGTGGLYGVKLVTTGKGNGRAMVELYDVSAMGKRRKIDMGPYGNIGFQWLGSIGIFNFPAPWNEMRVHWAPMNE